MRFKVLLVSLVGFTVALLSSAQHETAAPSQTRCCLEAWNAAFNSERLSHSTDRITASAMDSSGNVYVTGWSTGVASRYSVIATSKYDPLGRQSWMHHHYPLAPSYSDSEAWGIAVDPSGNVYVAGHTTGLYGTDYCLIKYPSTYEQGQDPEWVRTYNGPGNGNDQSWDCAIDSDGNVYVTGNSAGVGTSSDYATLKYDSEGNQQWIARYDGTGRQSDTAFAVVVDPGRNVYVTGASTNANGNSDLVTVKYEASGRELWASRYDGPAKGMDRGQSLALDSSGGVYATGWSMGISTNLDYATIAYDPTGGQTKWVARYDGPASGNDQPAPPTGSSGTVNFGNYVSNNQGLVAVRESDGETYLYVTGQSTGVTSNGATGSLDIATIKYRAVDGSAAWNLPGQPGATPARPGSPADVAVRYNGPGNAIDRGWAVALDLDGNVYVAGPSGGIGTSLDYAVVKYDRNGTALWDFGPRSSGMTREVAARFNGPGNGNDQATGFATWRDPESGRESVWRDSATGTDHVCVTGGSVGAGGAAADYYALMLRGVDGSGIWGRRYDWYGTVSGFDVGNDVVTNAETGLVYVTGSSGPFGNTDAVTLAYGPTGNLLWEQRYNGSGNRSDAGVAVAVDAAGNVYVAGSCAVLHDGAADSDFCTFKYDGLTGTPLWGTGPSEARLHNGPGTNATDSATAIALDAEGNVYVTGVSNTGGGTPGDYFTIAYAPDGSVLWTVRYDGASSGADAAAAVAVRGPHVYVTGNSTSPLTGLDIVTLAYDRVTGTEVWVRSYDGTGNSTDTPYDLAIDLLGNVFVGGSSIGPDGNLDFVTLKYDGLSGNERWARRYAGPGGGHDEAWAVAVDRSGAIYVAGGSTGSQGTRDAATVKYAADGALKWVSRYNGPGNLSDEALDVTVSAHGSVYVAGYCSGSGGSADYLVAEYDGDTGTELMLATYNGDANAADFANAIATGGDGKVFVTGTGSALSQADDVVTIEYVSGALPVASAGPDQSLADNTCPLGSESVTLDASSSADPDGEIVEYSWSEGDSVIASGADPRSTVAFPVGIHTITLAVTNSCRRTASDTVVITVRGPVESDMLAALIALVKAFHLERGIDTSLTVKLTGALASVTAAQGVQRPDAINKLTAFVHECLAQRDRALTAEQADRLIREANCVIEALRQ